MRSFFILFFITNDANVFFFHRRDATWYGMTDTQHMA